MRVAERAVCEGFTAHVLHEIHLRFPLDDLELDHLQASHVGAVKDSREKI